MSAPANQRLVLVALAGVAVLAAVLLAMSALSSRAAYFYSPADVARDHLAPGLAFRLGGLVQPGSLRRAPDGVTIRFLVVDGTGRVPVRFAGIVPDLFREGSGVIADGRLADGGLFVADTILAKHDENYRPPEPAGDRHQSASLAR